MTFCSSYLSRQLRCNKGKLFVFVFLIFTLEFLYMGTGTANADEMAQPAGTNGDVTEKEIDGKISQLMNEKYAPAVAAPAPSVALPASNVIPPPPPPPSPASLPVAASPPQTKEQGTIKNDVSHLFNEKYVPSSAAPQNTGPIQEIAPPLFPASQVAQPIVPAVPVATVPSNIPAAIVAPAPSTVLPAPGVKMPLPSPSTTQVQNQVTITNDVDRLFNEKLVPSSSATQQTGAAQQIAPPQFPATRVAQTAPAAAIQPQGVSTSYGDETSNSPAPNVAATALPSMASPSPEVTPNLPSTSLGLASQTPASLPVPSPLPSIPAPEPPTPNTPSSVAINSESSLNPEAPHVAVPPTSSPMTFNATEPTMWDKEAEDPAREQPITPNTPAAAKAAISEAQAAASIAKANNESAGNASDIPDAAYIRNLAGNGFLNLDIENEVSAAEADRTVPVDKPVHLDEAVAFALKNNFDVQASEEKVRGSFWDKMGAYAQYGPSVEYDWDKGTETSQPAAVNDSNGNRVMDSTHGVRDWTFTVRQPLIDLSVVAQILAAHDREDAAKSDQKDVQEGVALDTVNAFFKLIQARIAIRLADQYRSYLDNLAARMTARVEGGGGTNADLDRIRSRSELAYSARIEALGEYATELAELRRLTKIRPSQIEIPELLAPPVPNSIDEALDKAVEANPSYQSSLSKMDQAADDRDKSYADALPKLSLQLNKSFTYDAYGSAYGNPVDGVFPDQKDESVMVVMQWMFGGASITGGLSGQAKMREMRLESQDVLDRMEQAMRASYTAINAARQRRSVLQKTVEANERVVKGFEEQYKEGTRSLFDLLDSYEQLYSSKLNLMRVVIANAQASYQVRREMGVLIPTIVSTEKEKQIEEEAKAKEEAKEETKDKEGKKD